MIARNNLMKWAAFLAFVAPVTAMQAHADVSFDFGVVLTGDTPVGSTPWANVSIVDSGADTVTVTVTNLTDPADGQFLTALYLNIDPFVDVTASNFVGGDIFNPDNTVLDGEDAFHTANYTFDLFANFDTSNSGGTRFNGGDSVSFDLSGDGLSSASFLVASSKDGSPDTFGMIHIQGIPGDGEGSSKIGTVPEPASMAVLGLGALALARRRRKNA
jgi:hypothetical protein